MLVKAVRPEVRSQDASLDLRSDWSDGGVE